MQSPCPRSEHPRRRNLHRSCARGVLAAATARCVEEAVARESPLRAAGADAANACSRRAGLGTSDVDVFAFGQGPGLSRDPHRLRMRAGPGLRRRAPGGRGCLPCWRWRSRPTGRPRGRRRSTRAWARPTSPPTHGMGATGRRSWRRAARAGKLPALPARGWTAIGSGFDRCHGCGRMPTEAAWTARSARGDLRARSRGPPRPRARSPAAKRVARGTRRALYLRDKVALTTEERRRPRLSAVPIPATALPAACAPRDLSPWSRPREALYVFPWSLGNFRDSLDGRLRLLDRADGEAVIGYAVLMVAARRGAPAQFRGRRGTGTAAASDAEFLAHMIEVARGGGAEIMYLEVRPSNLPARHLYRRAGFQQIAIRPDYYPALHGREDALFLGLTLVMDRPGAAARLELLEVRAAHGRLDAAAPAATIAASGASRSGEPVAGRTGAAARPPVGAIVDGRRSWDGAARRRPLTAAACALCRSASRRFSAWATRTRRGCSWARAPAPTRTPRASPSSGQAGRLLDSMLAAIGCSAVRTSTSRTS